MKSLLALLALAALGVVGFLFLTTATSTEREENPSNTVVQSASGDEGEAPAASANDLADVGTTGGREVGDVGTVSSTMGEADLADVALGTGILRGSVVTADGQGVAGARIKLTRFGSESFFLGDVDPSTDAETLSGPDGSFEFTGVPEYGGYALIASMEGFTRTEIPSVVVQDGQVTEVPPITLGSGVVVRGRVTDTGGNAVPGARLILSQSVFNVRAAQESARNGDDAEAETDENGAYTFNNVAPRANYAMRVSAEGYGSITELNVAVLEDGDTEKDFVLEVASLIAGAVRASDTGEAIAGVTIEAYSINNVKTRSATVTKTSEAGEFEIADINPGPYQLVARHPRYKAEARTRVDSGEMDVTIVLEPLPMVTGQVVDLSTGKPITNFDAQLRQTIVNSDDLSSAVAGTRASFSDPEGRFEIMVPKAGEYMVEAMAKGFAETSSDRFSVQLGSNASGVVVRMTRGGAIVGKVIGSDGQPLSGAVIESHDKEWSDDLFWQSLGAAAPGKATETTARTGADGSFELSALTPANYQLVVRHRDHATKYVRDLIVAEGQEFAAPTIKLERGAVVSGMVLGPGGSPMAGAIVKMFPTSAGGGQHSASTNPQGEFTLRNVRGGSYRIHATRARVGGESPFQENSDLKRTQRTIAVQNGQDLSGVDFRLSDR